MELELEGALSACDAAKFKPLGWDAGCSLALALRGWAEIQSQRGNALAGVSLSSQHAMCCVRTLLRVCYYSYIAENFCPSNLFLGPVSGQVDYITFSI